MARSGSQIPDPPAPDASREGMMPQEIRIRRSVPRASEVGNARFTPRRNFGLRVGEVTVETFPYARIHLCR